MYKFILIASIFLTSNLSAQKIVFTVKNSISEDEFWKVNISKPFVYENISDSINNKALYNGKNKGPISTSHNGNYYVFQSDRFDNMIDGYEAITICKFDFSNFEVPKDAAGNAFHSEGIMQISNDGNIIYFVQGGGSHDRDIYKITKGVSNWSTPVELTNSSNFIYNTSPYLSYNETKIIFESSQNPSNNTAISEVATNAGSVTTISTIASIPNCIQMKSPCYDNANNIYLEIETDGERIWKINATSSIPFVINNTFTNDNSPITLSDGRIASLYLPNSSHQIKIMNADGLNNFMITDASTSFDEVLDIGISAGGSISAGISEQSLNNKILAFPNPSNGNFNIKLDAEGEIDLQIINSIGQICFSKKYSKWDGEENIELSNLANGIYLLQAINNNIHTSIQLLINK